ncbi:hypothetical protein PRIC1_009868 [Phytophthora ramorum]
MERIPISHRLTAELSVDCQELNSSLRVAVGRYTMASDAYEPESEPNVRRKRRQSWNLWRVALSTALTALVVVCFVVSIAGQAAYVTPLYRNHLQSMVATWWGAHEEMVDPSYLLLVGVTPTLLCAVVLQWLRRLRTQRGVWSVAKFLRRRPSVHWLSYGELLFLLVLVGGNALVFWYKFTQPHGHRPHFTGDWPLPEPPGPQPGPQYIKMIGNALGFNCVFNLALLFLPATRHSVWMDFMGISYANGIKYHRWMGVAAVLTGFVHCGCYYWCWFQDGRWAQMALPCWDCSLRERTGRRIWINVFGELALLCFLLIGVTSIPWVRRNLYNVFYNVHQLLFVAVVFTALHWARALWFLLPTFVAYLVSRVLSHCNGATAAKVVHFSALSATLCKLVITHASSERGRYQVGQFVYVNVPAVSRLEWHAFTIASSPRAALYDESSCNTMTILVKVLGDWTEALMLYEQACRRDSVEPEVHVDGYYGASLADVYLAYNTVVLVGGGVGMTPMLGVLEDVCVAAENRQAQGRSPFPRRVAAIFAMREVELLKEVYPLLARVRDLDPQGRYLSVHLALTSAPRPDELDSPLYPSTKWSATTLASYNSYQTRAARHTTSKGCPFGATFDRSGMCMVQFATFAVVVGLVAVFQFGNGELVDGLQDSIWVVQTAVKVCALFAAGICVYSGVLVMKWTRNAHESYKLWRTRYSVEEQSLKQNLLPPKGKHSFSAGVSTYRDLVSELRVSVGQRPDLAAFLRSLHAGHHQRCSGDGSVIGVLVSGPESLKTATSKAVASIGASDFDIHAEEFEL